MHLRSGAVAAFVVFTLALTLPQHAAAATLYAFNTSDQLLTIDTATGVGTDVGSLGAAFSGSFGLSFSPDGTLFGVESRNQQLLTINTMTGAATVVGPLGFANVRGIAFGPDGTLFGQEGSTNQLLTINTSTGAATAVGALGFGRVVGLAFSPDGTLFGTDLPTHQLLTINTTTGAATAVLSLALPDPRGATAIAFSPDLTPSAVPLPATLPLFGAGLSLIGLGGWWRRRSAPAA